MAKKRNLNENCPLSEECGKKKCDYRFNESDCAYYKANSRPDAGGEDILPILDGIFEDDKNILVYLDADKLYPHPDNPRKDLGDLEELSNSIKANGIMQNLTVVPRFDGDTYTVIIGHRRLAAAKLAGVDEVPCVIVDMTPEEQLSTMLLENMQRSDLTPYEQAQGFKQLMIDFGQSVEKISEKTGFSQSTVRRRIKLAELDQDKLKKAAEKQISLSDLERLNVIEDVDERNKLLDVIGTNNFDYSLKIAISNQDKNKLIEKWREYLTSKGAVEVTDTDGYEEIAFKQITDYEDGHEALAEDMEEGTKYYFEIAYSYVTLLIEDTEQELPEEDEDAEYEREKEEAEKAKRERTEREEKIRQVGKTAYELRRKFIFEYTEAEAKKHLKEIIEFAIGLLWNSSGYMTSSYDWNAVNELLLLGVDMPKGYITCRPYEEIKPAVDSTPVKALLTHIYGRYGDGEISCCAFFNLTHTPNKRLELCYRHLCALGYEMSDEEKAMLDGTSELFLPKENK